MDNSRIGGTIVEVHEIGTNKVTREFFNEVLNYEDVELKIDCGYIWLDGLIYGRDEPSYGFADEKGNLVDENYFKEHKSVSESASAKQTVASKAAVADARLCALSESFTKCKVYRLISYPCRGAMQHVMSCTNFIDMAVRYEYPDATDDEKLEKRIAKCRHIVQLVYKLCEKVATEAGKPQLTSIQHDFKLLHADLKRQFQQNNINGKLPSSAQTDEQGCLAVSNGRAKTFLAAITPAGKCHQTGEDLTPVPGEPKSKLKGSLRSKEVRSSGVQRSPYSTDGAPSNLKEPAQATHCAKSTQVSSDIVALNAKVEKLACTVNAMAEKLHKQETQGYEIEELTQRLVTSHEARDAAEARAVANERKIASLEANVARLNKEIAKRDVKITNLDVAATKNKEIAKKDVEIARQEATLAASEIISKKDKKIAKLQAESNEASIKLKAAETELARLRR
ncbi:hypothetical protein H4R20_004355 [Coemansia guatemalensis]|uniref:Uncharacterized protein n=1 Tax=Coemansia guatemalensis TaxID=2761395 RepID=A0A9W8HYT1_9FUNG|nr:hypothetical protein H4R20_004355 [Coemansia guatemalensis]